MNGLSTDSCLFTTSLIVSDAEGFSALGFYHLLFLSFGRKVKNKCTVRSNALFDLNLVLQTMLLCRPNVISIKYLKKTLK